MAIFLLEVENLSEEPNGHPKTTPLYAINCLVRPG